MKKTFRLIAVAAIVLTMAFAMVITASADVIIEPVDSFYERHRDECEYVNRSFYLNGPEGYVGVYKTPEKDKPYDYFLNGGRVYVNHSWGDGEWGVVGYSVDRDGNVTNGYDDYAWIRMSDLTPVYDHYEFINEHELEQRKYALLLEDEDVVTYSYPGAADGYLLTGMTLDFTANEVYVDEDGREWICIPYLYGSRNNWICVTDYTNDDLPAVDHTPDIVPAAEPGSKSDAPPANDDDSATTGIDSSNKPTADDDSSAPENDKGMDGTLAAVIAAAAAAVGVAAVAVIRRKKSVKE